MKKRRCAKITVAQNRKKPKIAGNEAKVPISEAAEHSTVPTASEEAASLEGCEVKCISMADEVSVKKFKSGDGSRKQKIQNVISRKEKEHYEKDKANPVELNRKDVRRHTRETKDQKNAVQKKLRATRTKKVETETVVSDGIGALEDSLEDGEFYLENPVSERPALCEELSTRLEYELECLISLFGRNNVVNHLEQINSRRNYFDDTEIEAMAKLETLAWEKKLMDLKNNENAPEN